MSSLQLKYRQHISLRPIYRQSVIFAKHYFATCKSAPKNAAIFAAKSADPASDGEKPYSGVYSRIVFGDIPPISRSLSHDFRGSRGP